MFADVLRQFLTTALILVVVIAFGAAVKPLSSGSLISGWDTLKYLMLAMVPMLQFALPFAAAFAVTMSLHRMAQDNEIVAMSACGQSYVRLLAPMAAFGLSLTIIVAILTQSIIPTFIGRMADAMTSDLPRLLANSIKQHTPFVQGDLVIWAEDIYLDTQHGDERMALDHVAVAKTDEDGRAKMYLTAAAAIVDVQRVDNRTSMYVGTRDATQWTRGEGNSGILRGAREGRLTHAIELQSMSNRRSSTLTRSELLHLRTSPAKYPKVADAVVQLRAAINQHNFLTLLQKHFAQTNSVTCVTATGGRKFILKAKSMKNGKFIPPIEVTSIRGTGDTSVLVPNSAKLIVDLLETGEVDSVTLQMNDVVVGFGEVGENVRGELVVPSCNIENIPFTNINETSYGSLLALAKQSESKAVNKSAKRLEASIVAMQSTIIGRIGQRWAVSMLPLLVILLGSVLAIRFAKKMPLAVYAKVFIPGVIALLLIFSGGQMVRDAREVSGFAIMWAGNIGLALLILFHWSKLRLT